MVLCPEQWIRLLLVIWWTVPGPWLNLFWLTRCDTSHKSLTNQPLQPYQRLISNVKIPIVFQSWPEDALQAVASRFLEEIEMSEDERAGCIMMCKHFHTSTRLLSERFALELERHNYVTPTSYLELISTFKTLLDKKRRWGSLCWFSAVEWNVLLLLRFVAVYFYTHCTDWCLL